MSIADAPPATPYDLAGREAGLRRIVELFYDIMDTDPAAAGIRAMHEADLAPMRDRLFDWLSGWTGGPKLYFQRPDAGCIVSAHRKFEIGETERDQWMGCMRAAFVRAELPEAVREMFEPAFARMAESFRNR